MDVIPYSTFFVAFSFVIIILFCSFELTNQNQLTMTTIEARKIIADSINKDLLNSFERDIRFPSNDFNQVFKGLSAMFEFVNQQAEDWNTHEGNIPVEFQESKNYFERYRNDLITMISNQHQSSQHLYNIWNNLSNQHSNTNRVLLYSYPETQFLFDVYKDFPPSFAGSFAFITSGNFNANDKNSLVGVILAYEFTLKDHSQIIERRNAEKASISKIRSNFEKYLSTSESQLIDHLNNANQLFTNYSDQIDETKISKEKIFNDWYNQSVQTLNDFKSDAEKQIDALKDTYENLLKLKEPANYWKERSRIMKSKGDKTLAISLVLVSVICIALYCLLWQTPESMLKSIFENDKNAAIRWSIVFITFLSAAFFGIKPLIKLTFSHYHLARDAEEREKLMVVYLSMIQNSKIEKEDRQLIMQSLFSRADTGLLKDDSSPTMPGAVGLLEKFR